MRPSWDRKLAKLTIIGKIQLALGVGKPVAQHEEANVRDREPEDASDQYPEEHGEEADDEDLGKELVEEVEKPAQRTSVCCMGLLLREVQ